MPCRLLVRGPVGERDRAADAVLDHGELARLAFSVMVAGPTEDADRPRWVQCTAWGDLAEQMAERLTKGTRVRSREPTPTAGACAVTCSTVCRKCSSQPDHRGRAEGPSLHEFGHPSRVYFLGAVMLAGFVLRADCVGASIGWRVSSAERAEGRIVRWWEKGGT
jgi:hypothetical protein